MLTETCKVKDVAFRFLFADSLCTAYSELAMNLWDVNFQADCGIVLAHK